MVEIIELLTIVSVVGMICGVVVLVLYRVMPQKKAKTAGDASVSAMYNVYNQQVADVLKLKDNQIKAQANKLRRLEDPEGDLEEEVPIPPELLAPIAKKLNMQPQAVQALLESPQIKKMLGKNKDILPMLMPLLGGLGGNQNQNGQANQETVYSQNQVSQ